MIILDIETDGLLDSLTKIHCAVAYDTRYDKTYMFSPDHRSINQLISWLDEQPKLSCHNGIGFDLKVLKKLYNYEYKGEYFDTLLASRILWPDIDPVPKTKGRHSVEAWGERFGIKKPEHEDWSQFSEDMLYRCREDVKIQTMLYEHIKKHVDEINTSDKRVDFYSVYRHEQEVWKIIEEQADNGWQFDLEKAYKLISLIEENIKQIDKDLVPKLPVQVIRPSETVTKAFTQKNDITVHALNWYNKIEQLPNVEYELMGDFSKVIFEPFNLNSEKQLKAYLLANGWNPKIWNFKKDKHNKPIRDRFGKLIKTSPKLPNTTEEWEEIGIELKTPELRMIADRSKASHRLSQIKGLIELVRQDHRIEARANTAGTNTCRMRHIGVVNIPKARDTVYLGKEMRSLFIAAPDKVLVGCDASALEARIEAHYIYPFDPANAMELIEGDIHTKNMEIFKCDRDKAKNGKYAIGYGCAAPKLASTIGCSVQTAEAILEDYWNANHGLKRLKELLEESWGYRGYILSLDKRPLTVRYKHALINTLFQSAGSICMKLALCIAYDRLCKDPCGPLCKFVGNFHDEFIIECAPDVATYCGQVLRESIIKAGRMYKLNVPLEAEYKIGANWAEVH